MSVFAALAASASFAGAAGAGVGVATVSSMSFSGCGTNGVCTVTAATAGEFPWSGTSLVVKESPYLRITGVENPDEMRGRIVRRLGADPALPGPHRRALQQRELDPHVQRRHRGLRIFSAPALRPATMSR
jgi:hypothetical protein